MLHVRAFTFNPFGENTYLIQNGSGSCWIVDPGMYDAAEIEMLFEVIRSQNLTPKAVLNTHAHIDHVFGVQAIVDRFAVPFHLHPLDLPLLERAPASAAMFGFPPFPVPQPTHWLKEGDTIDLEGDSLQVFFTPGHSPGSVCFYNKAGGWVIGSDVLFAGSVGRTDLPGGDHKTLLESIRTQLLSLPDDTTVYPGHGPATTIGAERRGNPFLT